MTEYYRIKEGDSGMFSLEPVELETEMQFKLESGKTLRESLIGLGWTPPQETEPKQTDWNRYKGCVVEMGDNDKNWYLRELGNFSIHEDYQFRTNSTWWRYCRLPSSLTVGLLPHDGSEECPVDDDQRIVYMSEGMTRPGIAQADILRWEGVTAYLPINFVLPE